MSGKLKAIKTRIKAVKETQQITKAMKMVSAAKLRRAQDSIIQIRPYANKLNELLQNIIANLDGDIEVGLAKEREINKVLIVLVTSDRGLCGSFNTNLIKVAKNLINEKYSDQNKAGNLSIITVGKKGFDFYSRRHDKVNDEYTSLFSNLDFSNSSNLADELIKSYLKGSYDVVELIYAKFKNPATQIIGNEQFLPINKDIINNDSAEIKKADFIYEPGKQEMLETLIPIILRTQFHRTLLDNNASEHGARMTAMDKATENCDELLGDLRISFNRARQEAITKELSEIVGGAAALEA